MIFRLASKADAACILSIYKAELNTPFCKWDDTYPGTEEIENDLKTDNLFVLEDGGRVIGTVSIVPENELDGQSCWSGLGKTGEFARVAVVPDRHGEGLSRLLVDGVLDEMRRRGLKEVHISVVDTNTPAVRLYRRAGFAFVGEADLYGYHFCLCEKAL